VLLVVVLGFISVLVVALGWFVYDSFTFAPMGEIAYECDGPDGFPQICLINTDGTNERIITSGRKYHKSPSWSPDGQLLAYVVVENGRAEVATYNYVEQQTVSRWLENETGNAAVYSLTWSPDGKQLLLNAVVNNQLGLYILVLSQVPTELTLLIPKVSSDTIYRSAFSRDGTYIYFADEPEDPQSSKYDRHMYRVRIDGSRREELGKPCLGIAISPDGLTAACNGTVPDYSIKLSIADWNDIQVSTNWSVLLSGFRDPAWSPDGQYIVYRQTHWPTYLDSNGNGELWIMRADGSHPVKLTDGPNDHNPAWRPQP
jgi:Tol biopolymer transport system component